MFGLKSGPEAGNAPKRKGTDLMNQMGLGVPADMETMTSDVVDDDDLEAELAALTGGEAPVKKTSLKEKEQVSITELEQMVAKDLQDVDEDVSDTEDPELLSELVQLEKDGDGSEPTLTPTTQKSSCEASPSPSQSPDQKGSGSRKRQMLMSRRDQYRHAALAAKRDRDMPTAAKYARIAKQFDNVLNALDEGKPVDLSGIPPALQEGTAVGAEQSVDIRENGAPSESDAIELPPEPTEEEAKKLFQAPEAPKSVMEALNQRLEKYKTTEESARQVGDSSKARRMGRIVKQYEDAIKAHSTGKTVDFKELPTPPGFGPIPVDSIPSQQTQQTKPPVPTTTTASISAAAAAATDRVSPSMPQSDSDHQRPDGDATSGTAVKAKPSLKRGQSRQEYQLQFLRERMEEFRTAALKAKRKQDLEAAKQHLRKMKGMEPMIEALEAGQTVDLSQVPPSPVDNDGVDKALLVVDADNFTPAGNREELFSQLEQDLISQIRMCVTNSQHFTQVGDIPAASKFQKLEKGCRKDLELLKKALSHGDPVPKFHYETRNFSVIQCNTDLGDGEMELIIVRGISFSLPSGFSERDMDTAVKYEFAFPSSEDPQTGQTSTKKSTVHPEYGESFKLQIDRKSRSFARFVERKGVKLEIYIKRGFFKGDQLLGSATVKLSPLDTKCTLHDSFELAEGRKSVGGKVEVKVRVRDPFKGRHVEESQEKWLVIDQFIQTLGPKSQAAGVKQQSDYDDPFKKKKKKKA